MLGDGSPASSAAGRATTWLGTAAVLGRATLGIGHLSVGMPGDELFTKEVGSVTGQKLIERALPRRPAAPAEILVVRRHGRQRRRRPPGRSTASRRSAAAERSADGRWVRVAGGAGRPRRTARPAEAAVDRLRDAVHAVPARRRWSAARPRSRWTPSAATNRDNRVVVPLILVVVLLILVLLLRALVAPLLLIASVVLSFAAALGAGRVHPRRDRVSAAVTTRMPLQAFLFLVALGVDYTIFLMTRAREEAPRWAPRQGVLHALAVTGGVITSAGVVLAATFAALGVLPLVPSMQTGVIVAVGVLLDTLLVRTPAGPGPGPRHGRAAWWPGPPGGARRGPARAARPAAAAVG